MYTAEDLEKAFEAGRDLQAHEDGEYEGYSDVVEVDYTSFEEWLKIYKDAEII